MTLLEKLNATDRFAKSSDIVLTHIEEGLARAEMTVGERHLNGAGVCHGGAIFTLADLAFAAVANSHGTLSVGVENGIVFHKSARLGDHLTATCREEFDHHRLPYCTVEIHGSQGGLIASATGLAYRTSSPMEFEGLE